jgi:hypothetical protein
MRTVEFYAATQPLRAALPDRLLRLEAGLDAATVVWLAAAFVAAAVFANVYPFDPDALPRR